MSIQSAVTVRRPPAGRGRAANRPIVAQTAKGTKPGPPLPEPLADPRSAETGETAVRRVARTTPAQVVEPALHRDRSHAAARAPRPRAVLEPDADTGLSATEDSAARAQPESPVNGGVRFWHGPCYTS